MKKISFKSVAASVAAMGAMAMPVLASAAFTDGLAIPSGTTANVTGAVETYFFPTVMATLFQSQMIQIMVVIGTLGLIVWAVKRLYKVFRHPGR